MTRASIEGQLQLDRATYDALVEHARSDFPFEVCGLLAIRDGRVETVYRIPNAARSMTYFTMDRDAMARPYVEIDQRDDLDLGIYHSHTHTEAFPSPTDVEQAGFNPQAIHVIVSLQDADEPAIRAFSIVDEKIAEYEVLVDGATAPAGAR